MPSLSWEGTHPTCLPLAEKNVTCCHFPAQSSLETWHPRILLWDWSGRLPLSSNYQNPRLWRESRDSAQGTLFEQFVHREPRLFVREWRAHSESQFQDASRGPALPASPASQPSWRGQPRPALCLLPSAQHGDLLARIVSAGSECR